MNKTFLATPTDDGQWGVRLSVIYHRKCDLPPCPGMGGWRKAYPGAEYWSTRVHGEEAVKLDSIIRRYPRGYRNLVELTVREDGRILEARVLS